MLPSSEYYLACEYYVCKNECERDTDDGVADCGCHTMDWLLVRLRQRRA